MRQTDSLHRIADDPYAAIADFYDLEHDTFTEDLPFYQNIVDMVGDPVVEFACGSGRILSALAHPGRRITGVDSSMVMLDRCRNRFGGSEGSPTLICQSMTQELPHAGQFGVAIIGLSSLHHLTTQAEQLTALRVAAACLDPRGLLVLDLANPLDALTREHDGVVRHEQTLETIEGRRVDKFSVSQTDAVSQIVTTMLWYDEVDQHGHTRRFATSMPMRFIHVAELVLMVEHAGFHSAQIYGTYELDPFVADSSRLIALVERSA